MAGDVETRCAWCSREFEPGSFGTSAKFCSTNCRQLSGDGRWSKPASDMPVLSRIYTDSTRTEAALDRLQDKVETLLAQEKRLRKGIELCEIYKERGELDPGSQAWNIYHALKCKTEGN